MKEEYWYENPVVMGVINGTALVHAIPFGLASFSESSLVEKITTTLTALAEVGVYYGLAKAGIPAYYLPIVTNVASVPVAVSLYMRGFEDRMHEMISGGYYGLVPPRGLVQLELPFPKERGQGQDVYYL